MMVRICFKKWCALQKQKQFKNKKIGLKLLSKKISFKINLIQLSWMGWWVGWRAKGWDEKLVYGTA
jgi:hypothetical protein